MVFCFVLFAGIKVEVQTEVGLWQTHVVRFTLGVKQSLGRRIKIRDQPELGSKTLSQSRCPYVSIRGPFIPPPGLVLCFKIVGSG